MTKPLAGSYPSYFDTYISLVEDTTLATAFMRQRDTVNQYFENIPVEKADHAYAEGKWTLKTLLQHIIDTERIFCYRALSFARMESLSLPGFDENRYAAESHAPHRTWLSLCDELKAVRAATELLFESFEDSALLHTGTANGKPCSALAAGFIIIGHLTHHQQIIESRYL